MSRATSRFEWYGDAFRDQVLVPGIVKGINAATVVGEGEAKRMMQRRSTPSLPGQPPRTDIGTSRRSITSVFASGRRFRASYGTNLRHMAMFERKTPTTISAVNKKYLTIPVNEEARRMRRRTRDLRTQKLVFRPGRDGRSAVLLDKSGRLMFVLKPRVIVHPRPLLVPSMRRAAPRMLQRFASTLKTELAKGFAAGPGGVR